MKKALVCLIISIYCLFGHISVQCPNSFNYQAVIRDAQGIILKEQPVSLRISIIEGSPTGNEVYKEAHSTETDNYGTIGIEVGMGSTIMGNMGSIDWGNGKYFIKTELDLAGGSDYKEISTAQLVSVPYAIHAGTADKALSADYNTLENTPEIPDPVSGNEAAFMDWDKNASDDFDGKFNSLTGIPSGLSDGDDNTHLTEAQVDKYVSNNGYLTDYTVSEADVKAHESSLTIQKSQVSGLTYSVGDFAQGGIVFWVDESGMNGLVCAKNDQSDGVRFSYNDGCLAANGDGPFAGEMNTSIILAKETANAYTSTAARIVNKLQITESGKTYADWYLPSKMELDIMYQNKAIINATAIANGGSAFATGTGDRPYWSSTTLCIFMYFIPHARYVYFNDGKSGNSSIEEANRVRAVRAF